MDGENPEITNHIAGLIIYVVIRSLKRWKMNTGEKIDVDKYTKRIKKNKGCKGRRYEHHVIRCHSIFVCTS